MQALRKVDNFSFGILTIGALGALVDTLARPDRRSNTAKAGAVAYYGLMGAAAVYRLIRLAAPKPASERRLQRLAELNDQAERYQHQLRNYSHDADRLIRSQYRTLQSAIHKLAKR